MGKIIVTGNDQRREYELGPINTVGRHPDNTLQILDRIVSKEHAQIIRQPDGHFLFRDLGSLNGSFLRGERMIEGARVVPLRRFPDERGTILHMLSSADPHFDRFGEVYFTTLYPGSSRAGTATAR